MPAPAGSSTPRGRVYVEWQPPTSGPSRRRRRWVINLLVVLVFAVAVAVPLIAHIGHDKSVAPPPADVATPVEATAAETWLGDNIPTTATIVSDSLVASDLRAAGFAGATSDVTRWAKATYLVSTPAVRATAAGGQADLSSVPIALFGSQDREVTVRKIMPGGTAKVLSEVAADYVARQSAGKGILANPNVAVDASARASMVRGALDVRAETLIALLAAEGPVAVSNVITDPAEDAAGIPARQIHLAVKDGYAIDQVVSVLPASYRPSNAGTGNGRDLQWAIAVPPVTTVH